MQYISNISFLNFLAIVSRVSKHPLFRYMLRGLDADTEYEVRIVTLTSEDTSVINKKTFSCLQSTTFLTEITGRYYLF